MTAQPSSQAEREDVAQEVLAENLTDAPLLGRELHRRVLAAMLAFSDREHATPRYTYDVTWSRSDGERFTCPNLTPKLVTARIIQAIKTSGSITIHAVEGRHATPRSMPEEVVEAYERAAKVAEERAAGRVRLYEENGAPINAHKAVEAEEIAAAIRAIPGASA